MDLIILCTHNDGGVGKTTIAVHVAGVLGNRFESTLLVDCDDQADFWRFHTGRLPQKANDLEKNDNITVIYNERRESITKDVQKGQYDHIVLDIDSPLKSTVQTIVGNDPNLILVPVNKSQKIKALRNLPRTLRVISQLENKIGCDPQVIIVPLGISQDSIGEVVSRLADHDKPNRCRIAPEMDDYQDQMQTAIYQDRKYIWDYEGLDFLYDYFADLLSEQ
ncbi:ParA family protein [Cronbergia sp. UHCC 0137]|uniref:ParA family protein n=1 Tax=Cronbergia sp. UHCC 0137 TaxID=3110239 RepID=UPI002B1F4E22|nr:ParA family protein [Cronbergia sp. UHCC 0137]MEA5618895.1 ParA family protein [Cronbergia sp. UHCC 0137]